MICRSLHVCLWVSEGTYALCAYKHGDKVGSWSPTGTWLAGRDSTALSALSTLCEDDDNIRIRIGSFHGGKNWDCGCLGYLLNCAVCHKMLVMDIGDECVNVSLASKLCGMFSFTLRQLYGSERACGPCWMQWRTEGGFGGLQTPPRNSEVLTKSNRLGNWTENV